MKSFFFRLVPQPEGSLSVDRFSIDSLRAVADSLEGDVVKVH